jgi:DNA replication protein DnaC
MIKLEDLMPDVAKKLTEAPRVPRPSDDERAARRKATALQSAIEQAVSRVPPAYAGAELDAAWLLELVGAETMSRARDAILERAGAFVGHPGSGKSSLAAAIYKHAARQERETRHLGGYRWISSHKLAKARANLPLGEGEAPIVEAALSATFLVLDELGGEDPRYASAVAEVLYERYEQQRPTWITTGVGSKEIATRYGGGIARRVFENAAVFKLGGKS